MKRTEWIAHGRLRLSRQITHSLTRCCPYAFHGILFSDILYSLLCFPVQTVACSFILERNSFETGESFAYAVTDGQIDFRRETANRASGD